MAGGGSGDAHGLSKPDAGPVLTGPGLDSLVSLADCNSPRPANAAPEEYLFTHSTNTSPTHSPRQEIPSSAKPSMCQCARTQLPGPEHPTWTPGLRGMRHGHLHV